MTLPVGLHGTETYSRQSCIQINEKKTFNHVYTLAWEKKKHTNKPVLHTKASKNYTAFRSGTRQILKAYIKILVNFVQCLLSFSNSWYMIDTWSEPLSGISLVCRCPHHIAFLWESFLLLKHWDPKQRFDIKVLTMFQKQVHIFKPFKVWGKSSKITHFSSWWGYVSVLNKVGFSSSFWSLTTEHLGTKPPSYHSTVFVIGPLLYVKFSAKSSIWSVTTAYIGIDRDPRNHTRQ